jgi:hypothetical protein
MSAANERQKVLCALRHASVVLHDPLLNPDTMSPERREYILTHFRVDDSQKII